MSQLKALKIINVGSANQSKDGRNYKIIEFVSVLFLANIPIVGNKILTRVFWEKGPEHKTRKGCFYKGDYLYSIATVGMLIMGKYARKETTPYTIREGQKPVNTYATLILEEDDENSIFKRAGEESGFTVLNEN